MAYGRVLAVEYDGSTNVLRSIDGVFTDSFSNVRFTYDPTLGFDRGSLVLIRHQKLLNWSLAVDCLMFRPQKQI